MKVPLAVLDAEIRWASKIDIPLAIPFLPRIKCCDIPLVILFLPRIDIASKFKMSKTKCGYFVTFGMVPYFRKMLINNINSSPFNSLLFDESLNEMLQMSRWTFTYGIGLMLKVEF